MFTGRQDFQKYREEYFNLGLFERRLSENGLKILIRQTAPAKISSPLASYSNTSQIYSHVGRRLSAATQLSFHDSTKNKHPTPR